MPHTQVNLLRDEKRHLETTVGKQQELLTNLEEERIDKETLTYLSSAGGCRKKEGGASIGGMSLLELIFSPPSSTLTDDIYDYAAAAAEAAGATQKKKKYMSISGDTEDAGDIDRLLKDLEQAQGEVVRLMNDASETRSSKEKLQLRLDNLSLHVQEYQRACQYYEKQASAEGLPLWQFASLPPTAAAGNDDDDEDALRSPVTSPRGEGGGGHHLHKLGGYEEAQLQEVASTTIGSLKRLIEEKNR